MFYLIPGYLFTVGLTRILEGKLLEKLTYDVTQKGYKFKEREASLLDLNYKPFVNDFGYMIPIFNLINTYFKSRNYKKRKDQIIDSAIERKLCEPLSLFQRIEFSTNPTVETALDINIRYSSEEPIIAADPVYSEPVSIKGGIMSQIVFCDEENKIIANISDNYGHSRKLTITDPIMIMICHEQMGKENKKIVLVSCDGAVSYIAEWLNGEALKREGENRGKVCCHRSGVYYY